MKRIKQMAVLPAVVFVLTLMGCGSVPPGTTVVTINEADFQSDSNGLLTLNNYTGINVAVFAGKVERGAFLGAIRARSSRVFDLNKIPGIPRNGAFLFRVTSYEELNKKGKAGITENDVIYTGLVAYDLSRPDRAIDASIFNNIDEGQETYVYVSNLTRFVVELRLDSSIGEKVGVLSPGQRNKKLWIKRQENGLPYTFFPTYVYVNPNSGDIDSFTDTVNMYGTEFIPLSAGSIEQVYEFKDPATQPGGKQYNVAFVKLNNDSGVLVRLQTTSGAFVRNQRGNVGTNRGDSDVYELASDQGPEGRVYSGLGVRYSSTVDLSFNPVTVKPGFEYACNITQMNGTMQYDWKELGPKSVADNSQVQLFME
jgi:hypothetical protein